MGIPVVVGWSENIKRTGASFEAFCSGCGRVVKMYEAVKHTNVSAYLAISLWDDEDPVVQCGECLGIFTDEDADLLRGKKPKQKPAALPPPAPKRPVIDDASIDAELAAMKKRLGK